MSAPTDTIVRFGRYALHPRRGLTCGRREVHVTQKALQVLALLAGRPGVLVTKHELFSAVWPDTAVSDAALTSCIQELRQALQDDARKPRFIETLHRRGFRFLPATHIEAPCPEPAAGVRARAAVGRSAALATLHTGLEAALAGSRQLVVVSGEAGIGKTTLVEDFIGRLSGRPGLHVARADCVERWSAGEPYQPLLDAVARLCRAPGGAGVGAALERYAPSWQAQLPMLQSRASRRALERQAVGVTRERMHRELTDCLEAATTDATLILWLDDVHWSDLSTYDWMAAFVQRPEPARVLLVATCRHGTTHPFEAASAQFRLKPWCRSIALAGLEEDDVLELVTRRIGGSTAAEVRRFAGELHAHTEGHPLFVRVLLDELGAQGLLAEQDGQRRVPAEGAIAGHGVPDTLRHMIEWQVGQLTEAERALLEAASVVGGEWPSAVVAAAVEQSGTQVEPILAGLVRRGAFLRRAGTREWPDGTRADCFAFVHAIHRSVLDNRLSPGARVRAHRLIGERIERAYGADARDVAAQLAVHFEEAGDLDKAVRYLALASQTSSRRGAAADAHVRVTHALALLERTAPSRLRVERELDLQMARGSVVMAARGFGAPEVEEAYDRARHLCASLQSGAPLFPSVWGLWLFRWGRGDLAAAAAHTRELERLSFLSGNPTCRLQSHHAHWATAFSTGDLHGACAHAASGHLMAGEVDDDLATYGHHDAGVCSQLFLARALATRGELDGADGALERAMTRARDLSHPFTLGIALVFAASVSHLARRTAEVEDSAAEAVALSEAHGFRLVGAWAGALLGWARAEQGDVATGVPQITAAVQTAYAIGSRQFRTYMLGLVGEAHLKAGNQVPGLAAIDEALQWVEQSGERFHEAELHRLRGRLVGASGGDARETNAAYGRAIATATRQGARLFLKRATSDRSSARQR